MVNYELGKIYKIIDNTNGNIYVGSTAEPTLARRLAGHRSDYKYWINGKKTSYVRSFDILKNEDFKIVLIETFPCESRDQLLSREQHWMDSIVCINHHNAKGRNKIKLSVSNKKYYEKNTELIIKKVHDWNQNNKDKRVNYNKIYADKNKDKAKIYNKKYRDYQQSFGGNRYRDNCSLLKIDITLFD
tara:strand:+ start:919 stop:1479 length:561 start_codon:yes stop_codon:yes gene_type:complete